MKRLYTFTALMLLAVIASSLYYSQQKPEITIPDNVSIDYSRYKVTQNTTYLKVAKQIMVDWLGEDYFNKHFYLYDNVTFNPSGEDWYADVLYAYKLEVGNHINLEDFSVQFDRNGTVVMVRGVPPKNMLMPFTVTEEQAVDIAKDYLKPSNDTKVRTVLIRNIGGNWIPSYNGYAWDVQYWKVDSYYSNGAERSGISIDVFVDLYTGAVITSKTGNWSIVF
jgi:hypothetical protein